MAISPRRDDSSVFDIQPPVIFRIIPLATSAFFLANAGFLFYRLGFPAWSSLLQSTSWSWLPVLGLPAVALLMLRLAFPGREANANLQVRREGIRFVPRRIDRRFSGENVTEVAITDQSTEILLCRSFFEGMPDGDRLVVRGSHGHEQEIRVQFYKELDFRDCQMIAERITAVTGLPVRLVIRQKAGGTSKEFPWIPIERKVSSARNIAILIIGALPFAGGIVIGLLRLSTPFIAAAGAALWLAQLLIIWACARWFEPRAKGSPLYLLTTVFTFGAAYGLSVVVVIALLH